MRRYLYLALLVLGTAPGDRAVAADCPETGTFEVVEDTTFWTDRCYAALSGHLPVGGDVGDAETLDRDIDRDGTPERLEVRGSSDIDKLIWVFRRSPAGFRYAGRLSATPSFYVAWDSDDQLIILNVRRMGVDDVWLEHIRYADGRFEVVRRVPMQ